MKITKELENEIKDLLEQGKIIEAVSLVQKELNQGLKISKEIVDKYRSGTMN